MSDERYTVYVDVSAKIEQWKKNSVIAVANDHTVTLLISAKTKAAVATTLQDRDTIQYTLLAVFTYLAVRTHLAQIRRIVIDMDYSGEVATRTIQRKLAELLQQDDPTFKRQNIIIKNVAGTQADLLARAAYQGKIKVSGEITLQDILNALAK